jgi:hypothetical protein
VPITVEPGSGLTEQTTGYWPTYGPTYPGDPAAGPGVPLPTETEGPHSKPPYVPEVPYLPGARRLVLISGRGDVLTLTDRPNGYRVRRGVRGLGMPPTDLQRRAGAGDGSRWQRTRREERVIDLPVQVEAENTEVFAARVQRLIDALDDRYGPPTLTVLRPDGRGRTITVRYAGGAEWQDGLGTGGPLVQLMPLSFVAMDPFFRDANPVTLGLGTAVGTPFIPFGAPLLTSASRVIGELELSNPGDADAYGVWTLSGPGGPFVVRSLTDGVGFTFATPLLDGEVVAVDTDAKTVTDATGANRYADLGPAPRLWAIPPGRSKAQVSVENSTGSSSVSLAFRPRWKTGG